MITTKMKRKDLELDEFSDDFSDFSLSSPARKIRRLVRFLFLPFAKLFVFPLPFLCLPINPYFWVFVRVRDAELPPIMEEEEAEIPLEVGGGVAEDMELPSNEERAIVLFKPVNASLFHSQPSNLSFSVDSHIISGFKNQLLGSSQCGHVKSAEEEALRDENGDCLAVVPWVPSQLFPAPATEISRMDAPELMEEAEEMEAATMDIEEDNNNNNNNASIEQGHPNAHAYSEVAGSDGLHQCQQLYHCMIEQLPQNTSTPITWFR